MIDYCNVARGTVFLVGYTRGDSSTALPDNFSCPYRNDQDGLAPQCCKGKTLEKCLKFQFMAERVNFLNDSDAPIKITPRQKLDKGPYTELR